MKTVGILYHPMIAATQTKAKEIKDFLDSGGFSTWLCSAWEEAEARARLDDTSLILTVGGDGTILRAAQITLSRETPITGINLGKLGFMTELSTSEVQEMLPSLLAGEGWSDERAMLTAEHTVKGQEPRLYHALNDIVVARGEIARLIRVEASLDDKHLATYRADGVIVATATGSTGYSLASGGPILYPQSKDFLLVPVVPHLSPAHSMVLPPTSVIRLKVATVHPATLSIDGHINLPVANGDIITVKPSPHTARFLRIHPQSSFYGSLEKRLKGKQ